MKNTVFYIICVLCSVSVAVCAPAFAASVTSPADIPTYYSSVDNTSEGGLWSAVYTTAKRGYSGLSYKALWSAYATTDRYPSDPSHPDYEASKAGHIWDMYSNCSFVYSSDQCGSYRRECDCYNREHSIPKSWFGDKNEVTASPGTDLFHIVPTDGSVNNTRSSYAFGEVGLVSYTYDGAKFGEGLSISIEHTMLGDKTTSTTCVGKRVFEPQDKYKGDFARMYMGTLLRWNKDYHAFTTGDGGKIFSGTYTAAGHWGLTEYGIALLLKWHRQDPVSQKEIDRNNGIQTVQGNRNPFVDYPYLAEFIWGEKAGETVHLDELMPSTDPDFIPGLSNGWRGKHDTSDIENLSQQPIANSQKLLINGHLYIMVGDQLYTITGQRVK